jgi:hypothetical protein
VASLFKKLKKKNQRQKCLQVEYFGPKAQRWLPLLHFILHWFAVLEQLHQ